MVCFFFKFSARKLKSVQLDFSTELFSCFKSYQADYFVVQIFTTLSESSRHHLRLDLIGRSLPNYILIILVPQFLFLPVLGLVCSPTPFFLCLVYGLFQCNLRFSQQHVPSKKPYLEEDSVGISIYTQRMVLRFVSIIHRHLLKCFFFFAKTLEFSFYYNVRVFPVYKNRPFVTHSYRFLFLNLAEIFIFKITIFFCSWENKFCL